MKRKDGRELVTEHPVTAVDRVEYIPREELDLSKIALSCTLEGVRDTSWDDEDPSSDDFDDWGA